MTALEKLWYGAQVMLIGLAIVFFVLILLIVIIYLLSALIRKMDKSSRKGGEAADKKAAPAPAAPAPTQMVKAEAAPREVTDHALIAAIAAAIAAFTGNKNLVVRSVRRVAGWKSASRAEQVCRF